jgi:UDP-N-acetylmuramate--alanine ligase
MNIIIGEDAGRIDETFEKVIYTEAVPKTQNELKKAIELGIPVMTYPESLAEIANQKKLITIAGTHGKSTTTSMTSLVLKNSQNNVNALVGSLLKEFDGKNVHFSQSDYFVLEACEYKRSFLRYKPFIGVVTNIEIDHLDYYKDLEDYISAFIDYTKNIVSG